MREREREEGIHEHVKMKKNVKRIRGWNLLVRVLDSVIKVSDLVISHISEILFMKISGQASPERDRQLALGK